MKNLLHKKLITLFTVVLVLFTANNLQAQNTHEPLWGVWSLEIVEISKQGVSETHSYEALLADKENLPRNMFTSLYFFDDNIGINTTESEFVSGENLNQKGLFGIENGNLIITLFNEQPRIFSYVIENECLKLWYKQDETEFYLVYTLTIKN